MEEIKSFLPEELKAYQICVARWQEIDINTIRNILEKRWYGRNGNGCIFVR